MRPRDPKSTSVSSRQASRLLGVHESSVKRWCNAGELDCWLTAGGHRRIPVAALMQYARTNEITPPLGVFESDAGAVWSAVDLAARSGDYSSLSLLCYEWLEQGRVGPVVSLLRYALAGHDHDALPLHTLLASVVGYSMGRVGAQYHEGLMSIGDEHRMTQAMRDVLVTLFTMRASNADADKPVALVGCALSEEHELGALVVRLLLQEAGWRPVYLGLNVPTEEFATQQSALAARLVCISLMKPRGLSEANSIVRLLDKVYDATKRYDLVLGGSAMTGVELRTRDEARIPTVQTFETVEPFVKWLSGSSGSSSGSSSGRSSGSSSGGSFGSSSGGSFGHSTRAVAGESAGAAF